MDCEQEPTQVGVSHSPCGMSFIRLPICGSGIIYSVCVCIGVSAMTLVLQYMLSAVWHMTR